MEVELTNLIGGKNTTGHTQPESPIEEIFQREWEKAFNLELEPQRTIDTDGGRFRLDFVFAHPNGVIAIECDGKDYHDKTADLGRDLAILRSGEIAKIFRFTGRLIYFAPELALNEIATDHASLFGDREREVVRRKAEICEYKLTVNDITKRERNRR